MKIGETREGHVVVLSPQGRIDNETSAAFQARLLSATAPSGADVLIDFAGVEYISSAGLRGLMAASKQAKKHHGRIAVTSLNALVKEIFEISRFSYVLPVFATVAEAIAAWQRPAHNKAEAAAAAQAAAAREAAHLTVRFWGTRGSLPAPLGHVGLRKKIRAALLAAKGRALATPEAVDAFIDKELPFSVSGTFGGNSSCVEIVTGGSEYVLCDLGTGARDFGNRVIAEHGPARKNHFNIFMSHVHWDHIMGFPFFTPAYIPGNVIRIYGCHKVLREAFLRQQSDPCFPVDFRSLGSSIEFVELEPGRNYEIAGLTVRPLRQFHAGDSYGYRFTAGDKSVVYSTDSEHKYAVLDESYPFVEFFRDVDLLIFDAMYSHSDAISVKEDWGHASNISAVELAQLARVKHLVLYHHEPAYDDRMIEQVLNETIRFEEISRSGHKVAVSSAYDGLEIVL